jgi:hypothetical protein
MSLARSGRSWRGLQSWASGMRGQRVVAGTAADRGTPDTLGAAPATLGVSGGLTAEPGTRPAAPAGGASSRTRSWRSLKLRTGGSLGRATEVSASSSMTFGEAEATPAATPSRHKKSWREQRWERRRRRRVFEEILGWIFVPIIVLSAYWAVKAGLAAFGTTPTALIEGIKAVIASRSS